MATKLFCDICGTQISGTYYERSCREINEEGKAEEIEGTEVCSSCEEQIETAINNLVGIATDS